MHKAAKGLHPMSYVLLCKSMATTQDFSEVKLGDDNSYFWDDVTCLECIKWMPRTSKRRRLEQGKRILRETEIAKHSTCSSELVQ